MTVPSLIESLRRGPTDVSFSRSRRTELGVVDYLPYQELVEPDVMLTTYGALGSIFEVQFEDTSVLSDEDALRHEAWKNDALRRLGRGWMIHTYALRSKADPLEVAAFVTSDAHRVLCESHVEHASRDRRRLRHLVALTYLPPTETNTKLKKLVFSGESPIEVSYERVRAQFERGLLSFEGSLRRVAKTRRLGTHPQDASRSELLEAIFELLWDEAQPIRQPVPFEPFAVGEFLAARDISPVGTKPKVGNKHLRVLSVYGVPSKTQPNMMEAFLRASTAGCRFSVRCIFQNAEQAKAKLDTTRRQWAGQRTSMASKMIPGSPGREDRFAALNEEKSEDALLAAAVGSVAWAHWTAKAVFLNEDFDALTDAIEAVRTSLQSVGFTVNEETVNIIDGYFGHVPFNGHHDVREGQVHTMNAARMWPSSSRWAGRQTWNCKHCGPVTEPVLRGITTTSEDFFFDSHDEEDTQSFVAIGSPGAGKTSDLNTFAANYRRTLNDQVFGIDKNRGQLVTCKFLGGDYRENEQYCLFDGIDRIEKRRFLEKFLVNLGVINGVDIEAEQRSIVKRTLEMMVQNASEHRSLSTFVNYLSASDSEGKLSAALSQYAEGGAHYGIFDGVGSDHGTNSYEVHELGGLLGGHQDKEALVAGPVLIWILNSFEDRLPGHRSTILVDEAWSALRSAPVAALLEDELRTMRYRHAGIGFFTHSLAEVQNSTIGKVIFATCKQRLIYPNSEAQGASREFFEALDLNNAAIDAIKNGVLKRDIFLSVNNRFGAFQLPRSPAELAVYACTGRDEVAAAVRLMEDHPDDWRSRHLDAYGCKREADRLRSLQRQQIVNSETIQEALKA
jgi:type IV secretory pathway VirB4 component